MVAGSPTIGISAYDYPPGEIVEMAKAAEEYGFSSFWFGEHYVIPGTHSSSHPASDGDEDAILSPDTWLFDPWFLLGVIAGATKNLKIGTAITIVPLNNPLILARATMTAHVMSGGRFMFGAGAGWLREEFEALGVPFERRGKRLDETLQILRKAWRGGFFDHHGENFSFESVQLLPQATPIPLICAGNSPRGLRRAAAVGDGWLNSAMVSLEEALRLREQMEALRRAAGTEARPFSYFFRPQTANAKEVFAFVERGMDNIVLWGPHAWPRGADISLVDKRKEMKGVAIALGIHSPD